MLINDDYLQMQQKRIILRKRKIELIHCKCSAPHYAKKFDGSEWVLGAKQKHQQLTCSTKKCSKKTRNYCACSPHLWRCTKCLLEHAFAEGVSNLDVSLSFGIEDSFNLEEF